MEPLDLRISELIKNSELSYGEIARQCGVDRAAVSRWVKTGKITTQNFAKLCITLKLDANDVLFGKEYEDFKNLHRSKGVRSSQKELIERILLVKESNDEILILINTLLEKADF
jgi:DNA-binding Xre family transcriptional regulator